MDIQKITGLIAAPFTPMYEDGSLNTGIIPAYAAKLKNDQLSGVFICGTTGEGMLMTPEERMKVAEKWIHEQTKEFKVIVHVGTTSSKQSNDLARHAEKNRAYGIGCMGPSFLPPTHVDELVGFCAEIAEGAPGLPFYYYHIPSISGVKISMVEFIQKAKERIPNLAGIKFTDNNFMDMQQCMKLDKGKWDILHGYDELLLAGLAFGAKGAVGSTYNFMATLYYGVMEDFENGNLDAAREKQAFSVRVVEVLNKYGGAIAAGKALMKQAGVDCGPNRLPIKNLQGINYENFTKEIESLGVLKPEKSGV
ncbi:N-acetylneuraminate lyase [Tangfeifania diversioriginum]|uniref:N-acetylneuraminate lyase n=1 Tax=Tangfeifania diversioriginum TaxID=1168035 RepID=A0A1M6M889_9BACT|nr:dihydrodipicolinate synthase family protein [Tangfeifania diversioriginum]SHJ79634.1 N-acetylneuraminate lyase [Tangfeifania diversioriginum]